MAHTVAWRLASGLILACCFSSAVAADGEKKRPSPEQIFKKRDADGDGSLSLEEFKTGLPEKALTRADARFKKLDTSGDGKVSLEEFETGMKNRPNKPA